MAQEFDLASALASLMGQGQTPPQSAPAAVSPDTAIPFGLAVPSMVAPGTEQTAQGSPYQIRPDGRGQFQVINIRTGQIHFVGSADGASNAQATLNYRSR